MYCARAPEPAQADATTLAALFDALFLDAEATVLRGGAQEPLYQPVPESLDAPAVVHFRADFAASALHEIAHWCLAGAARRRLPDYGYWYAPEGRNAEQQRAFLEVEAKPQALEWCFAQACGLPFCLSLDNLDAPPSADEVERFGQAVIAKAEVLRDSGLAPRADRFFNGLCETFRPTFTRRQLEFSLEVLGP